MKCTFCEFRASDESLLVQHYVKKHRNEETFIIQCAACKQGFKNVASLRSHFRRLHEKTTHPAATPEACQPVSSTTSRAVNFYPDSQSTDPVPFSSEDDAIEEELLNKLTDSDVIWGRGMVDTEFEDEAAMYEDLDDSDDSDDNTHFSVRNESFTQSGDQRGQGINSLTLQSARALLSIREEGMISQTALELVVQEGDNLFKTFSQAIKDKILEEAHNSEISEEILEKVFLQFQGVMFEGVDTKERLDAFAKDYCQVLDRLPVNLHTDDAVIHSTQGDTKEKKHEAFICPFLPALQRLLTRPDVQKCIENPEVVSTDNFIRSYRDGSYCREHPILSSEESLAVQFAYDDLEVSSPLGPKKHKLALYYWTLGNFYPPMRSSLRSINLYAIAWAKDLKSTKPTSQCISLDHKYEAHSKIMASFNSDMRALESGVELKVNGKIKKVKGCLFSVGGDTPAVSVMCGSKESVGGANKPCNKCYVNQEEMQVIFTEDSFAPRTIDSWRKDLESVKQSLPVQDRIENSTICGLNGPSVISGLQHFDYIKGFVFDTMHILHEGVLAAHMHLLLQYCVTKKMFSLQEINSGVKLVADQCLKKDKPAAIKPDHLNKDKGLRQTAAQMYSLALCLPFVLMKKQNELGDRFDNFLLLLRISIGLLCFEISVEDVGRLQKMIRKHHETFGEHYPDFILTPKFHYLIHLPSQILMFGPSRVTWTMRFEAMHSYFKNLMRIMKCFKNPPKSCSYRYECLRASQMLSLPDEEPSDFLTFSPIVRSQVTVEVKSHLYSALLVSCLGRSVSKITTCGSLHHEGVTFTKDSVIMYSNVGDVPIFAAVVDIVKYYDIYILLVALLKTTRFEPFCNSFVVERTSPPDVKAIFPDNLCYPQTLPCVSVSGETFIIPKYHRLGAFHGNF